jgi:Fe2+ or Zn2+ uptake regulation protein
MKHATPSPETLLGNAGLKITPARVKMLIELQKTKGPLSVQDLQKKRTLSLFDVVTLYRTLSSFEEKGLVRSLSLQKEKAFFEYTGGHHGHHIQCVSCETIETIPFCIKNISTKALKSSRNFSLLSDHALYFFGTCKKCARAVR